VKPIDKAIAVRRNWPFRSPDPMRAFERRVKLAGRVLGLVEKHGDNKTRLEGRRLFIVAVAAAFETFWRDLVRDAVDKGGITLKNAPHLGRIQFALGDMQEVFGRKLTLGELVSTAYTFQSLDTVDQALSDVLGIKAFSEFSRSRFEIREVKRKNRSTKHGALVRQILKGADFLKHGPAVEACFEEGVKGTV